MEYYKIKELDYKLDSEGNVYNRYGKLKKPTVTLKEATWQFNNKFRYTLRDLVSMIEYDIDQPKFKSLSSYIDRINKPKSLLRGELRRERNKKMKIENVKYDLGILEIERSIFDDLDSKNSVLLSVLYKLKNEDNIVKISFNKLLEYSGAVQKTLLIALDELEKLGYINQLDKVKTVRNIAITSKYKHTGTILYYPHNLLLECTTYTSLALYVSIRELCNEEGWMDMDEQRLVINSRISVISFERALIDLQVIHSIQLVYNYDDCCRIYLTPNKEIYDCEF